MLEEVRKFIETVKKTGSLGTKTLVYERSGKKIVLHVISTKTPKNRIVEIIKKETEVNGKKKIECLKVIKTIDDFLIKTEKIDCEIFEKLRIEVLRLDI